MEDENALAGAVVDAALKVHVALGPGLLESAYEAALAWELQDRGIQLARQVPIAVRYAGATIECGYRADIVVDGRLLVELKSAHAVAPVHRRQVLTYLRLGGFRLGLLLNFGAAWMRDGIFRFANRLPERPHEPSRIVGSTASSVGRELRRESGDL